MVRSMGNLSSNNNNVCFSSLLKFRSMHSLYNENIFKTLKNVSINFEVHYGIDKKHKNESCIKQYRHVDIIVAKIE